MKPIKKIAGDLLIYFYALQRKGTLDSTHIISFEGHPGREITLNDTSKLEHSILEIADKSANDAYHALKYLEEKAFIDLKERPTNASVLCHGIRLTAYGIDIIEGIERGEEEKMEFNITFNINLAENINIESLIKMELGSLIKASLI